MSGSQASTTPRFPGFIKQDLRKVTNRAERLYKDPTTDMLPALNQWTTQGIANRAGIAGGGNSIATPALDEARKVISGGYLDVTKDPNFNRSVQAALGMTGDRFANSGRIGGGSYAGAMSDAATGVAAQMYDVERGRQMDALSNINQFIPAQYSDSAALEDAGRSMDEDTMARFDWPYAKLDRWANTLYGNPMANNVGATSKQPFNWTSFIGGLVPKV